MSAINFLLIHIALTFSLPCCRSLRSLVEVVALGVVNPVKGRFLFHDWVLGFSC